MTFGMSDALVHQHMGEQRRQASPTKAVRRRGIKVMAVRRRVGLALVEVGLHVMTPRRRHASRRVAPSAVRGYAV